MDEIFNGKDVSKKSLMNKNRSGASGGSRGVSLMESKLESNNSQLPHRKQSDKTVRGFSLINVKYKGGFNTQAGGVPASTITSTRIAATGSVIPV